MHVILDILPDRIDAAAWADAFEETLRLLEAHPARLLGYGFRTPSGVRVPVYTRRVEQGGSDAAERRWCVVGDRATLGTGERQRMYKDLARYIVRCPSPRAVLVADDILVTASRALRGATPGPPRADQNAGSGTPLSAPGAVRVFGEGDQSEPCRLPLLAAAMVVESRFPRHALVMGHFEREHAEVARRWATSLLGRGVALPVRVDAFRLVERLGVALEGTTLLEGVERLLLAPPGGRERTLLGLFGRAVTEPWFLGKLREHATPDTLEARRALAAYLDATGDLGRLGMLACLDARGPRWAAAGFVAAAASMPEPRGLARPRFDDATINLALGPVLGPAALERPSRPIVYDPAARGLAAPLPTHEAHEGKARSQALAGQERSPVSLETLACLSSPGELDARGRECVLAVACAAREAEARLAERSDTAATAIASLLARGGPTLTEDAWDWIEREEDAELCAFLRGLAAMSPASAEQAAVRRALLENRALCRHAASLQQEDDGDAPRRKRTSAPPPT
jgi:hypothetical protein